MKFMDKIRLILTNNMCVIILGMHRSGTSCLTGSLQEHGLFLGEVINWAKHNQKGNKEKKAIMDLNEGILKASGGSWDSIPKELVITDVDRAARDKIIQEFRMNNKTFGFKDPRTLVLFDFWTESLKDYRLIGTIRNPIAVATSLHSRQPEISIEKGIEIWLTYNQLLVEIFEEKPFPIIDFDDHRNYIENIHKIAKHLGLANIDSRKDSFFDISYKNQDDSYSLAEVDDNKAEKLYSKLLQYSKQSLTDL